jgi:GAF domain-containing protein
MPAHDHLAHADPAKAAWLKEVAARYPRRPDARLGLADVLRTGKPEIVEVSESLLARAAVDEEHLRVLRAVGVRSYMIVPIVANGDTLGAITFAAAESNRRFGTAELAAASQLGT